LDDEAEPVVAQRQSSQQTPQSILAASNPCSDFSPTTARIYALTPATTPLSASTSARPPQPLRCHRVHDTEKLSGDRGIDAEAAEREAPKQSEDLVRTPTPIDGLIRRGAE
jgi:hypothetical protein